MRCLGCNQNEVKPNRAFCCPQCGAAWLREHKEEVSLLLATGLRQLEGAMVGQNVTTTAGETFSFEEHCQLAALVFKRFGRDIPAAASAWRRLLQNCCSDEQFKEMVDKSRAG